MKFEDGGFRLKKTDLLLLAGLLLLSAVCFFAYRFLAADAGTAVVIAVDGVAVGEYSLYENRIITIEGTNGTDVLEIKDGYASMLSAECPDGICVKHSPVNRSGESIICLPNRISVKVVAGDGGSLIDSIAR